MKQRSVSIVIPTYNGLSLLQKNLPAVVKAMRAGDELVIVDDASSDDTVSWLRTQFKPHHSKLDLQIIHNQHNLRFGAAVNKAVKAAHYSLVWLLNNDVSPAANALEYLLPHFEDESMFAVGCHERETVDGGISGGKNKLWFERGLFVHSRADDFSTGETAWASGGSALFDREKWLELGGFSSTFYPAYWEDIDLSYRAKQKGWKVWFEAKALVDHNHETTNTTVFGQRKLEVMSFRNALTFTWLYATGNQKLQFALWLPYHLFVTNWRTRGAFGEAFWSWLTHAKH